jgi:CubicO group peptidase (beta-lactamase class C family)
MSAQTDKLKTFRSIYLTEVTGAGIVGSSFVFLKDGKVASEIHYGSANIEKKQPVDENTIYHWASNTKPFTGIAIMQLRDRGLLKLDDPVTEYLPELREVHNAHGSMDAITIRHLLTHSAGFRNSTWPWDKGQDWEPFEPKEYSQLVAMFPFTEILFKPGTKFSYSNPGIIFLGRIIEKLSGDDYEVYVDKNILKPLGMHSSYFDATPYHLLKHRSHSYYMRDGKRSEGRFDVDTGITVSNSGLNSPISDMVKYLNFLIGSSPPVLGGVAPASGDGVVLSSNAQDPKNHPGSNSPPVLGGVAPASGDGVVLYSNAHQPNNHPVSTPPPFFGGVAPASADGVVRPHRMKEVYDTILKRSSLEEMWKPQLPTPVDANGNIGFTTDIGLIYFLNRRDGRTFIGHGGDQNGFISYIDFEPSSRQASIIVFNTNMIYPDNTLPEKNMVSNLRNAIRKLY